MSRSGRSFSPSLVLGVVLVGLTAIACQDEPPRRPNMMHPVDERRAVEIIRRTFQQANLEPDFNRSISISRAGKSLNLDVVAAGHQYGIAYLTREEAQTLETAIPKYDPESDELVVVDGIGDGAGWHALVLYDRAYVSDDLEGEAHSATTIAAEKKIERDTRDFLLKAKSAAWP